MPITFNLYLSRKRIGLQNETVNFDTVNNSLNKYEGMNSSKSDIESIGSESDIPLITPDPITDQHYTRFQRHLLDVTGSPMDSKTIMVAYFIFNILNVGLSVNQKNEPGGTANGVNAKSGWAQMVNLSYLLINCLVIMIPKAYAETSAYFGRPAVPLKKIPSQKEWGLGITMSLTSTLSMCGNSQNCHS